jgi:DNA ligase D-like protein (predicted 3'-phosphoesterase)
VGKRDELRTYREKRHFDRTSEPGGEPAARGEAAPGESDGPAFVVQIHDASTVHFDFRLEVGGVLKSWAVPKGPSTDPHDKRLAIPTEDHPLDYLEFEGVIPEGEYGGGTVIVWDTGTYRPLSHGRRGQPVPFGQAIDDGHAVFELHGRKLHGRYALTRFRGGAPGGGSGEKPMWLLVRTGSGRGTGGTPDPRRARSARSGLTLRQVAESPDAPRWQPDG